MVPSLWGSGKGVEWLAKGQCARRKGPGVAQGAEKNEMLI